MPFSGGKFTGPGSAAGSVEKTPPASTPEEKGKGPAQAAHGDTTVEHVTKTHPGETQPHPATGVHAFQAHHSGNGQYKSYTHHDGGEVEAQQHNSADEMHAACQSCLPAEGGTGDMTKDMRSGGNDFAEELGGIGGAAQE